MTLIDTILVVVALVAPWFAWTGGRWLVDPRWPAAHRTEAGVLLGVLVLLALACTALAIEALAEPFAGVPEAAPVVHRFVLGGLAFALTATSVGLALQLAQHLARPVSVAPAEPEAAARIATPPPAAPRRPQVLTTLARAETLPQGGQLDALERTSRRWLAERFDLPVDRRTSDELVAALRDRLDGDTVDRIARVLAAVDHARFSGRHPPAGELAALIADLRRFVERTAERSDHAGVAPPSRDR